MVRNFKIVLFLIIILQSEKLIAQESTSSGVIINVFPQRQQERRQSRWTLDSWMNTKRQVEAQNRWLWAHTNKVPIEFSLGYLQSTNRWKVESDLYLARIGFKLAHGRRVDWLSDSVSPIDGPSDSNSDLALQLRLFGGNLQDTYLILRAGYEHLVIDSGAPAIGNWGMGYIEPELQIYFAHWLGVRGRFRHRLSTSQKTMQDIVLQGHNYEAAAFIEMGALRIEAGNRWLNWEFKGYDPMSSQGLFGALKLHF